MHEIRAEILIDASPDKVWAVLADFPRYCEWNPLNIRAEGEARVGAKVAMEFLNLAARRGTIRQTVTLVACTPGRELAWTGNVPLLFSGRHGFLLTTEGGATRLAHTEVLRGLLPASWSKARIERDFRPAYEAVNEALAQRVAAG